ncbi:AAA family ATPase [Sphingosinicella microcystinivorans]|uniref:AAA family ATPase n=1 Tax=Sphingosinicella microcystinivorans TaxID=335406 RepID=UPI0022F38F1D|nr:AAA family ATPase [Sphingosinicella microcystinivorans]WBX84688.1 AAA family ATPase [Sphingosinicella microcystinivorans]
MVEGAGVAQSTDSNTLLCQTAESAPVDFKGVSSAVSNLSQGPPYENAAPDGPRDGASVSSNAGSDHDCQSLPKPVSGYHTGTGTASPLDRPITVTTFHDRLATEARRHVVTLRNQAPRIAARRARRKDKLPWLKLASFGNQSTDKGCLRNDNNVTAIDGVEGDHDKGTLTPGQAADRLRANGTAALIYTSPSHTPEHPRWRVLCPTSRSLSPDEREQLCARLQGILGGALAPESFTLSQSYYYGRVEGGAPVETIMVDGAGIDTLGGLDATALDKRGKPFERGKAASAPDKAAGNDSASPDTLAPSDSGSLSGNGLANDFWYVPPELLDDDPFGNVRPAPNLAKINAALAAIPVEARDDREACWRPVGMALHDEFDGDEAGFALWDEWSAVSPRYNARDQRRVWQSFGRHGRKATAIGTLYRMAKDHGWNVKAASPVKTSRLQLFTPAECMDAPSRGYVIKRLIAPRDVACIFGAPGGGKSTIAPYLGYRVATGAEAFGLRTRPGGVLYVAAEDAHGMKNRVKALRGQLGDAPGFYVVDGVTDLLDDDSPDLAALRCVVDDKRPALIFLDTLAMSFRDLEENDAASMNRVVATTRSLTCHGAAVVLIHHGTKAEGSTPRGHSVLNGALDVALQLLPPDNDGIIRGRLSKNRNGPCDLDIAFRVAAEELGHDEDGDAITAAIVDELPAGTVPRGKPLPVAQREALAILTDEDQRAIGTPFVG